MPQTRQAGFRFFQQVAQWVNDAIARLTTAEGEIDTLQSAVYVNYTDRGDPAAADFTSLTSDGAWKTGANALDFSSIVPSGAKAMLLRIAVNDDASGTQVVFRKSGQTNAVNAAQIFTQVSGVWIVGDYILACSSDRKVEYQASNTTIDSIIITCKGWWI